MKSKPGKVPVSSKSKKIAVKVKISAKPVGKPDAKAKSTAKPTAVKPGAKSTAKPLAKALPKVAAKPVVKSKVVGKSKVAAKAQPTAAVKPVAKSKLANPKSNSAVKSAEKQNKPAVKPKPAVKTQPTVKVTAKKTISNSNSAVLAPVKTAKSAKAAPVSIPATPVPVAATKAAAKTAVAVALVPAQSSLPTPPRSGRPSSRLAQLTVPSMAQSVASTAAKASYSQIQTTPMMVPPTPVAFKKDPKLANNWKTKAADQLTDAELQAMPEEEYMNDKQLAAFRSKLIQLKADILSNAGETTEHLREDTSVVPDPADRATIEEEHALELRTRDRERKLLKKIEQSIDRIDAGDYGYCDETGEAIGVGRLLARPTATLSLEAQQRRELKQKMFGD